MAFSSRNTKAGRTTTDAARGGISRRSPRGGRQVLRGVGKENQDCGGLQAAEKPPEGIIRLKPGAVLTLISMTPSMVEKPNSQASVCGLSIYRSGKPHPLRDKVCGTVTSHM
ncbi:hypothetical protein HPP92_006162 [Vanilla planifolia]|uniref:Uncharacterized protein n=1 Tax=Vanilla planifolia TaxID=51239 RepID=A0A835RP53_VANPL|nr:hypothetical protein HPP92_006162 [Vanilla planifolia]